MNFRYSLLAAALLALVCSCGPRGRKADNASQADTVAVEAPAADTLGSTLTVLEPGLQIVVKDDTFSQSLADARAAGFKWVELKFKYGYGFEKKSDDKLADTFAAMKKQIDTSGIKVWSIHLPYDNPTYTNPGATEEFTRFKSVDYLTRVIKLTSVFGAKNLVLHASNGVSEDREADISQARLSIAELAREAAAFGEVVCVENMCNESLGNNSQELARIVKDLNVKRTFDIGHANMRSRNVVAFLESYGTNLGTVHMHDNHGSTDEHLLPGDGNIGAWAKVYHCLLTTNEYKGVFMMEVKTKDAASAMAAYLSVLKAYEESQAKN